MASGRGAVAAAWADRILDVAVVLLATWALVYHLCLVLRWHTGVAVALEIVALVVASALFRRYAAGVSDGPLAPEDVDDAFAPAPDRALRAARVVTIASAVVAAAAIAVKAPWVLTWVPWLVGGVAGSFWAARSLTPRTTESPPEGDRPPADAVPEDRWTWIGVLVWAVGLAVYSTYTLRPNPDDLFYVNLSQWVSVHHQFPLRDTLFSELRYPMANWPPVASYDGLVGVVAGLLGVHAATVEYEVVPPIAVFLAVLALWRLLRAWRVRHLLWVLSTALVFLMFDGSASYASPGNLFVTRLWQGKIVLLCVVVPLLLVHALRYVERPSRRGLVWLGLGGVAAVGLTTTSIFLVPILALAAMAPLFARDRRRAVVGFAVLSGYALGAGVVTKLLHGRSADDFGTRRLYRFDAEWIGHQLLLTALVGFVVVLALLLGALLVPHRAARLTSGLLVLASGYVFVPGAMRAAYDVIGLGPTLWRISWAASMAALVGVLVVRGGGWLVGVALRRAGRATWQRGAVPVACVVTMALLAGFGPPVWSADTGTFLRTPFHWQRSNSSRHVVAQILAVTQPGDLVLAPEALSITFAVTTTAVKTVAPRDYYMQYLQDTPSFHYDERLRLVHYVNGEGRLRRPELARDLQVVGVKVACTMIDEPRRFAAIRAAGFRPFLTATNYRCLRAP